MVVVGKMSVRRRGLLMAASDPVQLAVDVLAGAPEGLSRVDDTPGRC